MKSICLIGTVVGVVFVGFVAYKVIQKKKPQLLEKASKSAADLKNKAVEVANNARSAFREGYENVRTKGTAAADTTQTVTA